MNESELRFLVDVGVGKGIERYLREEGCLTKRMLAQWVMETFQK